MAHQLRDEGSLFRLPPGFIFAPSDELLVDHYLRGRIRDGISRFPVIKEFDVYRTEPWNLPTDFFGYRGEESDIYFFTPRHPTIQKSKRANRTAGNGYWDGKGKDKLIKIGDEIVGHKTSLNFKIVIGDERIKTDWIMHEFRLSKTKTPSPPESRFDDFFLCRIHRKKSNCNHKRLREDEVEDEFAVGEAVGGGDAEERPVKRVRIEDERALMLSTSCQRYLPPLISVSDESCSVVPYSASSIPLQDCSQIDDLEDALLLKNLASIDELLKDVGLSDEF